MASNAQKLSAAEEFIADAPPGEITEVLADIRTILDKTCDGELAPAVEKHNMEQLITFKTHDNDRRVIVSQYNRLEDGSYVDYESAKSFEYDHLNNTASAWKDYPVHDDVSSTIAAITKPLGAYMKEHYPTLPAYAVYPPQSDSDQGAYTILIVGNKYNNSNFWNGRWRSIYKYSPDANTLNGVVAISVHYFEDGNVLLKTDHPVEKSDITSPSALIKAIAEDEKSYQEELNKAFAGLGDGIFKGLRRLLPVTKQKIEWEKVTSYKVKPGQK